MIQVKGCMLLAIVAAIICSIDATSQQLGSAGQRHKLPVPERFSQAKQNAACKVQGHRGKCGYSYDTTHLFTVKDITRVQDIEEHLVKRDLAKNDWPRMIGIKNKAGQALDLSFLSDKKVNSTTNITINDFPLEVYLQELWEGTCSQYEDMFGPIGDGDSDEDSDLKTCIAERASLVHVCRGVEGPNPRTPCTTDSLQLLRKRLGPSLPYNFTGYCHGGCYFNTLREWEIEACLGKDVGSRCSFGAEGSVNQGICLGHAEGAYVYCNGVDEKQVAACKDKSVGDQCKFGLHNQVDYQWQAGVCGYHDNAAAALSCSKFSSRRRRRITAYGSHDDHSWMPKRSKPEETCFSKQEVQSMRGLLHKILGKSSGTEESTESRRRKKSSGSRRRRRT